ncbi:MAG TPA: hypothetical protein DCZ76_04005 [Treponema sp.]|nr:hypothetical protein [Treponema sp.]
MERKRKGGKPRKMASLPFCRSTFMCPSTGSGADGALHGAIVSKKMARCSFGTRLFSRKKCRKKRKKWMGLKFDRLFD